MQSLRRRRRPVTAADLAAELAVSVRTVYRDVATLAAGGAPIEGEAGLGYVLRAGFFLPPLMLRSDELDAVVLGLRFVVQRGDPDLRTAAEDALAKIVAVLPPDLGAEASAGPLLAGPKPGTRSRPGVAPLSVIRRGMRAEEVLRLDYRDKHGQASARMVWPIAVGFFAEVEVLAAWCEARGAFRHFRLDRIVAVASTGRPLPKRRRVLMADWRREQNLRDLA
jgi:predicted DNA-binding transcriptional regulator YafY